MKSAMTIRIFLIGAATLVLSASSAASQGQPPQQVVISKAVMKSMVANKPKSKTPLTARVGMVRRSRAVTTPTQASPTSVEEVRPAAKRK